MTNLTATASQARNACGFALAVEGSGYACTQTCCAYQGWQLFS